MARFVALWSKPTDVEGFEEHYRTVHSEIVSRWPGVTSATVTRLERVLPKGEPEYHIVFTAEVADMKELFGSEAFAESGADAAEIAKRFGSTVTVMTGSEL